MNRAARMSMRRHPEPPARHRSTALSPGSPGSLRGVAHDGEPARHGRRSSSRRVSCFAEHGFEGTSLNDIAAGVGIRRASVLHHFPSKEAIYQEVFERALADWVERVDGQAIDGTPRRRRRGLDPGRPRAHRRVPVLRRQPATSCGIVRREALPTAAHLGIDLGAALRPLFQRASAYFEREMDAGRFRRTTPSSSCSPATAPS